MMTRTDLFAVLVLLTAHFVGDFLAQSDRMGIKKSSNSWVLLQHVGAYMACLLLPVTWLFNAGNGHLRIVFTPNGGAGQFLLITALLHFATDFVTSRMTSRLWFFEANVDGGGWRHVPGRRHWFFVVLGLDQLLHVYALVGVWWWLA